MKYPIASSHKSYDALTTLHQMKIPLFGYITSNKNTAFRVLLSLHYSHFGSCHTVFPFNSCRFILFWAEARTALKYFDFLFSFWISSEWNQLNFWLSYTFMKNSVSYSVQWIHLLSERAHADENNSFSCLFRTHLCICRPTSFFVILKKCIWNYHTVEHTCKLSIIKKCYTRHYLAWSSSWEACINNIKPSDEASTNQFCPIVWVFSSSAASLLPSPIE